MGYQDLSDYLDQLEGKPAPPGSGVMADPFGGTPTGTTMPAPTPPPAIQASDLTPLVKPRGPRVSVSPVGDMARPDSFQSIASAAPSGAGVTPPAPAPDPLKAKDQELAAAQAKASRQADMGNFGGIMADAGNVMRGGQSNPQVFANAAAQSQQGVKDLMARRDAARQATADATQREMADKNSPISKRVQMLAAGMGVQGASDLSAADFQRMQPLIEKGLSAQQAKAALDAENIRSANELASREKIAGQTQAGENSRAAAGRASNEKQHAQDIADRHDARMEEIAAKNGAEKNKPAPPQEVTKIINQGQAPASIDELQRLQKDVGASGYLAPLGIHIGAEGRYNDAVNNLSGSVAAGALPAARETPALMEEFKKGFPKGYNDPERAKAAFDQLRGATQRNMDAQISGLAAGGYSPKQIAELRRQSGAGHSAAPGGGKVKVSNGKETLMIDQGDVADAGKDGYQVVP